jgi:uncharacterized membrane protein
MYVCRDCGRTVCGSCFNPHVWKCQDCSKSLSKIQGTDLNDDARFGWSMAFTVFLGAFIMIFVGMMLMMLASVSSGGGSGGLVLFIGPFPIAVGSGPQSSLMVTVAFALAIVGMVLFFLFARRRSF